MGWIIHRHGVLYTQEYDWDASFEALVARIAADFIDNFDEKLERCFIAEMNGEIVGSVVVCKGADADTAKLRLLFVEPTARGFGLGDSLVKECMSFAKHVGYKKLVLWTNSILTSARKIYERNGFQLVSQEEHHSFGKDLVGETWEISL